MGKQVPDTVINGMLDLVEGDSLHICSAEPANFAGIAAVMLAEKTSGLGTHVQADGASSGRKTTCPAQSGISITNTGTANHVVLVNAGAIKRITTCTGQLLTSGGTVDTAAFAHTITDPT